MLQYTDSFEKYPHLSQLCIKITSVCVHRAGSVPLPRLSPAEFTALWKITFTEFCFVYLGGKVANDQLRICSHVLLKTVSHLQPLLYLKQLGAHDHSLLTSFGFAVSPRGGCRKAKLI